MLVPCRWEPTELQGLHGSPMPTGDAEEHFLMEPEFTVVHLSSVQLSPNPTQEQSGFLLVHFSSTRSEFVSLLTYVPVV